MISGNANSTRDVLNDHRVRNRPNKPPSEQQLINAAKHQLRDTHDSDADVFHIDAKGHGDGNGNGDDDDEAEADAGDGDGDGDGDEDGDEDDPDEEGTHQTQ